MVCVNSLPSVASFSGQAFHRLQYGKVMKSWVGPGNIPSRCILRTYWVYPCNLFILATPLTLTHTHIHMVGRLCPYVRMFSPSYTALWEAESDDVKMKGEWERLNCDCIYDIVYMCVYGVYCAQRWKHSSICGSPRYFIPLCTYFSCGVLTKYNPAKTDKYLKLQSWILSIIVTMFTRESGAR